MSGRSLRKLPVRTHARFMHRETVSFFPFSPFFSPGNFFLSIDLFQRFP